MSNISDGRTPLTRRLRGLRHSRKIFVAGLSAVLAISTASVAAALITGSTGSVIKLAAPPASVRLNALENATSTVAFDERQGVTLASAVAVDAVNPGTFTSFPSGTATVAAGTVVDSHLIHSDIPTRNYTSRRTGTVTFATNIVGVIASTSRLAASDAALGAPGTLYAGTTTWRGLEGNGGESGDSNGDKFTISADRKSISFDIRTLVMDEIRVLTGPSLSTTIADNADPVQAGDNIAYTINVTNNGTSAATGVQLKDSFPGATYVSATAPGTCTPSGTTVTCDLGTIAGGGSAAVVVTVTSPASVPAAGTTLTNTATAPAATGTAVSTTTLVLPPPSLTTTITDSPHNVTVDNNVQYKVTVTNSGASAVTGAQVVDTLPAGTTVVASELPANCTDASGTVTCTLGNIPIGGSVDTFIVAKVPGSAGNIVNSAIASPGPTNTAGTVTTIVEAEVDGVAKGFVLPGGSLTIPGNNPATVTVPNDPNSAGVPIEITQGTGTFCNGPCSGPATTISPFDGFTDPANPIKVVLNYSYPDTNAGLTQAALDFNNSIIFKDDGTTVTPLTTCTTPGNSNPGACVDGRDISRVESPTPGYVTTYTVLYLSGDPRFARN
jgi:uncharacterized repeat protein (TIGR01451 family)